MCMYVYVYMYIYLYLNISVYSFYNRSAVAYPASAAEAFPDKRARW